MGVSFLWQPAVNVANKFSSFADDWCRASGMETLILYITTTDHHHIQALLSFVCLSVCKVLIFSKGSLVTFNHK